MAASTQSGQPGKRGWFFRVLRAVALGLAGFMLLSWSPRLMLALNGIEPPAPPQAEPDEEPLVLDADGQRVHKPAMDELKAWAVARERGFTSHAQCKEAFTARPGRSGCDRYITEQKHIPPHARQGNWVGGKTTAQCLAEVDAYWRAVIQDQREMGNDRAADVWARRRWAPEARECQNYDNVRITRVVYEPTQRLDALLARQAQGLAITEEDRAVVRRDMALVSTYPDDKAKRAYLAKVDLFFSTSGQAASAPGR